MSSLPQQRYGIPTGGHSIIGLSIKAVPTPSDPPPPPRYPFDAEYLRRLRDGDAETVAHFIAYFRERLLFVIWKRGRSGTDADDLVQETFARVLAKLRSPDAIASPKSFGAFVFSVCRNRMHEEYRDAARLEPLNDVVLDIPSSEPSVEQRLLSGERGGAVRRTLKLLKARERELLIAVFVSRRPKDEVCAEYHITRANLRVVLHRAMARFRFLHSTEG